MIRLAFMWVFAVAGIKSGYARGTEIVFSISGHVAEAPEVSFSIPATLASAGRWLGDVLPYRQNRIELRCSKVVGFLPNRQGTRQHAVQTEMREQGHASGKLFVDVQTRVYVVEGAGASVQKLRQHWGAQRKTEVQLRAELCPGSERVAARALQLLDRVASDYSGREVDEGDAVNVTLDRSRNVQSSLPAGWTLLRTDLETARVHVPVSRVLNREDPACAQGVAIGGTSRHQRVFAQVFGIAENPLNATARQHFCRVVKAREAHNAGHQCWPVFQNGFRELQENFRAQYPSVAGRIAEIADYCAVGYALSSRGFMAAVQSQSCERVTSLREALSLESTLFGRQGASAYDLLRAAHAVPWVQEGVQLACASETPVAPPSDLVVPRAEHSPPVVQDEEPPVAVRVTLRPFQRSDRAPHCPEIPIAGVSSEELASFDPVVTRDMDRAAERWRMEFPRACAPALPYVAPLAALADTEIYRLRRVQCGYRVAVRAHFPVGRLSLDQIYVSVPESVLRRERLSGNGGLPPGETCIDYQVNW